MSKELIQMLFFYLFTVNLAAFCLMGLDKRKAKRDAWRIPEKALFLPVVLGGSLGGVLGMNFFHHKTKHWYFRFGFSMLLVLQSAGISWLIYNFML